MKYFLSFLSVLLLISCGKSPETVFKDAEQHKSYANMLREKGLFKQAISEYGEIQESGELSKKETANLSYLIGNVYMDDLHDYENALASYLKVKVLLPDSDLTNEVEKRSIECLERMGRSLEARQAMDKLTSLEKKKEIKEGTVIAKIGSREITKAELDRKIGSLPPYLEKEYKDPKKQLEFLKQYVATELMYNTAKRRGYEKDSDIIEKINQAGKSFLVQKLMEEEIQKNLKITESDVKNYYDAHKEDFTEKDKNGKTVKQKSYEEAKNEAAKKVEEQKQMEIYDELISRMLKAEHVTIYDDVFVPEQKKK